MSYLRTDECQDVLSSLEQCVLSLAQARRSERAWKWVILSLHSALQGAMVCHLSGPDQLGALTKKNVAKLLEWYEKGFQDGVDESCIPTSNEFVANANELFERLH